MDAFMKLLKLSAILLFAPIVALVVARAAAEFPRGTPEAVGLSAAKLSEATSLMKRLVAERKIAGAVAAVARHGKLAYLEAVGVQDLDMRTPMTERSLFRIYSMTKSVTAVGAMMLHEQGRFGLDDPVSKYLPEFKNVVVAVPGGATRPPSREITVRDLLLHTSGLNHRTSDIYGQAKVRSRAVALPQFIANITRVPLMEDPGTRYRYSESPTVVGRLIEIWSGQPLDAFVTSRIFQPLGMSDTTFWVSPEQTSRFTMRYAMRDGTLIPNEIEDVPFTVRPALLEGAVGLVSTVPDYLRFSQMLLNKGELAGARLLSAKTVEMMTVNGLSDAVLNQRGGGMGWGLANVDVVVDPAALKVPASRGEYTWNGSAGTYFWIDPTTDMITILMTQYADTLPTQFKALVQQATK
jgi:CubicO group peptidase (beta-lactamase class C family)